MKIATCRAASLICLLLVLASIAPAREQPEMGDKDGSVESAGRERSTRVHRPSARERAAARREAKSAAAKAKSAEEREKWLARLKVHDVEPWPEEETDETHADALAKTRKMVDEVKTLFPGLQIYETDHFLFVSDMPAEQVRPYTASVDRMYEWMCQLYGVDREHKVWLGEKVAIYAFLNKQDFDNFEDRYFPEARQALKTLTNIYGLSHLSPDGEVIIACFRGNDPADFGQMLVHETSHGFIHRYKSKASLPSWVDEGMADLIGAEMVPASTAVKKREFKAMQAVAQQGSLGGMLSTDRISAWQYGLASNLNRFLLQADRKAYVRFIECLKEGMKWDEALRTAYRTSPEEVLSHYSRWIGMAELRP